MGALDMVAPAYRQEEPENRTWVERHYLLTYADGSTESTPNGFSMRSKNEAPISTVRQRRTHTKTTIRTVTDWEDLP